jgi:hypothetical protein
MGMLQHFIIAVVGYGNGEIASTVIAIFGWPGS